MAKAKDSAAEELKPDTIILGERLYEAATELLIAKANRELLIFDPDLSRGGYQSLSCSEALRNFLAKDKQNRLIIVLHEADFFTERCPRLQDLLKTYSNAIDIYLTDDNARVAQDAFVLADKAHYLHRFHIDQSRFKYVLDNAVATKPLLERFDQLLETTSTAIFATTTGL
ncbi:MAG TPA: hypothetical protein VJB68_08255 [Methylophilaceae bacterium]|nr:hypothetical protein [Methylophilaceae bacterium]